MKTAVINQHDNGIYIGEIRDEFGDVESCITASTAAEVHKWASDHKCTDIVLE